MRILVFLHGTSIMHPGALGCTREERVRHVIAKHPSIEAFDSYVPVDGAVRKLQRWFAQGAVILYLSSHRNASDVEKDRTVLEKYGFPKGPVYFCQDGESYSDVASRLLPDILIEDDCESIGGEPNMTYPHLPAELRAGIKSIVVREFGGLDHLPDDVHDLLNERLRD